MKHNQLFVITSIGLTLISTAVLAAIPDDYIISQKGRAYSPGTLSVKAGETIKILNDDMFLHHAFVESENMKFDSGSMEEGDAVEILFKQKGVYDVMCAIHPKMKLEVTVE